MKRVAEKQATLEEEKKRKVQDRVREQPRALQVKRARELEIKEKNKKHKEVCPDCPGGGASVQLSSTTNAQIWIITATNI